MHGNACRGNSLVGHAVAQAVCKQCTCVVSGWWVKLMCRRVYASAAQHMVKLGAWVSLYCISMGDALSRIPDGGWCMHLHMPITVHHAVYCADRKQL